jgi:hypothetical protein
VFVNQYLLVQDLGRGAHGSVKLVYSTEDDAVYAMKVGALGPGTASLLEVQPCVWLREATIRKAGLTEQAGLQAWSTQGVHTRAPSTPNTGRASEARAASRPRAV